MSAVLRLKEERVRLRREKTRLTLAADAAMKAAKDHLATSAVTPLAEIDIPAASDHLAEALRAQNALAEIVRQIHKIDRELGE